MGMGGGGGGGTDFEEIQAPTIKGYKPKKMKSRFNRVSGWDVNIGGFSNASSGFNNRFYDESGAEISKMDARRQLREANQQAWKDYLNQPLQYSAPSTGGGSSVMGMSGAPMNWSQFQEYVNGLDDAAKTFALENVQIRRNGTRTGPVSGRQLNMAYNGPWTEAGSARGLDITDFADAGAKDFLHDLFYAPMGGAGGTGAAAGLGGSYAPQMPFKKLKYGDIGLSRKKTGFTNSSLDPALQGVLDTAKAGYAEALGDVNKSPQELLAEIQGGQSAFYNAQKAINDRRAEDSFNSLLSRMSASGLDASTVMGGFASQQAREADLTDLVTRNASINELVNNALQRQSSNASAVAGLFGIANAPIGLANQSFMGAQQFQDAARQFNAQSQNAALAQLQQLRAQSEIAAMQANAGLQQQAMANQAAAAQQSGSMWGGIAQAGLSMLPLFFNGSPSPMGFGSSGISPSSGALNFVSNGFSPSNSIFNSMSMAGSPFSIGNPFDVTDVSPFIGGAAY